jgi:sortase B
MAHRAEGIGRKAVKLADSVFNTALLLAILLLLSLGFYALWDSDQVYSEASAERYGKYCPEGEYGRLSFGELVAINPEVVAWLTVYGTHIDYPVTQGPDNMKYVNTDAEGAYSLSGCIFLDSGCSSDFSDFSSILYGHHMEKEALFGEIGLFDGKSYFDARRYGKLYYGGEWHGLEFFAFLKADAYDGSVFRTGIEGREEGEAYLGKLLSMAVNTRGVQVDADDRIVLLSTCSPGPTNGRDILVGKLTDKVHADPFAEGLSDEGGAVPMVDRLGSAWSALPLWAKAALVAALAALLLAIAWAVRRRRSRKRSGECGDSPRTPGDGDGAI